MEWKKYGLVSPEYNGHKHWETDLKNWPGNPFCPGIVKSAGAILTTLPIEFWLVFKNMDANTIYLICLKLWKVFLPFFLKGEILITAENMVWIGTSWESMMQSECHQRLNNRIMQGVTRIITHTRMQ